MGAKTAKELEVKLKKINRGAYFFGMFGKLLMFLSFLGFLPIAFIIAEFVSDPYSFIPSNIPAGSLSSVSTLIIGYLFLLARDAFEAIAGLITEIQEIV